MKQHEKDSQKQPDERTLMFDGHPKSETGHQHDTISSNQSVNTTSYMATTGSTDDSTYVDVKPVISDVCGGVDCLATLAPMSTELSDTVLDEIVVKDEYECSDINNTFNIDKTTTDCTDVEANSLNADDKKDDHMWTGTIGPQASNTTVSDCHVDHELNSETSDDLLQNEPILREETCQENELHNSSTEKDAKYK